MRAYIIRRLLLVIPTVFLTSLIIFFVVRLQPGNAVDAFMADMGDVEVDRAMIERQLGLDVPVSVQYGRWIGIIPQADGSFNGIFQGNLGESWWTGMPVTKLLARKWPITFELGLLAMIIIQLISLPIGIYSAVRQDTWGDYLGRSFAILCMSIPGFWLATMVLVFPAIWWNYSPPLIYIRFMNDPVGNLKMLIIPAFVAGMGMSGLTMRMVRTMMLEVLRQDYVRTAWAKGLKERVVILRHALKNALIPVVVLIGLNLRIMLGGTVIIEQVFNLAGMGRLIIDASQKRDYPLMSGVMLIFGVALVLLNLLVDITTSYLDPRVRYK